MSDIFYPCLPMALDQENSRLEVYFIRPGIYYRSFIFRRYSLISSYDFTVSFV